MSEAANARNRAGLTIEDAAQKARVCTQYLRGIERGRGTYCSYPLALRLARLYGCSANVFLYTTNNRKGSETAHNEQMVKRSKTHKEKPLAGQARGRKQGELHEA